MNMPEKIKKMWEKWCVFLGAMFFLLLTYVIGIIWLATTTLDVWVERNIGKNIKYIKLIGNKIIYKKLIGLVAIGVFFLCHVAAYWWNSSRDNME